MATGPRAWHNLVFDSLWKREQHPDARSQDIKAYPAPEQVNAIIEKEIIPRLVMNSSASAQTSKRTGAAEIDAVKASKFASLPLTKEAAELMVEVQKFLDSGVSVDSILVDLLAPAARKLGQLWEQDQCDFVDVTLGTWRLQQVMRELVYQNPPSIPAKAAKSCLFASMPGDQHNFGPIMIDQIFAGAGWHSEVIPSPQRRDILDRVKNQSLDLVGLTISRDCPVNAVRQLVTAIRSVSKNPAIVILIGGRAVMESPSLVEESGADSSAADARDALVLAEQLCEEARLSADAF